MWLILVMLWQNARKAHRKLKTRCKKSLEEASKKRREKTIRELELRDSVNISRVGDEEVNVAGRSEPHKLGPLDKLCLIFLLCVELSRVNLCGTFSFDLSVYGAQVLLYVLHLA